MAAFWANLRKNSYTFIAGTIPIQSFKAGIDFAKSHIYNRYGVFGLKIWIYKCILHSQIFKILI